MQRFDFGLENKSPLTEVSFFLLKSIFASVSLICDGYFSFCFVTEDNQKLHIPFRTEMENV